MKIRVGELKLIIESLMTSSSRERSKRGALNYVKIARADLCAGLIRQVITFLKRNGWSEDELTDLIVVQALWDDDAPVNDYEELVGSITRLNESGALGEAYDPESWYYDWEPGMTLQTVIDRWQHPPEGVTSFGSKMPAQKLYDRSQPVMIPISDLWPHREYKWRKGFARRSDAEWDELVDSMKKNGWMPDDPLWFDIGKKGTKIGEGNHRLAIAKRLGIKEVPVEFHYSSGNVSKTKVSKDPETGRPTPARTLKQKQRAPGDQKKQPSAQQRELTPEDEKLVNDIMNLL